MKKFMKRLFKVIMYIILIIIILISLFLLIINNKKFTVYSKYDWNLYHWWSEIYVFNDKLEIYPEFKKFNKSDLPEWYQYDWYGVFHLRKFELEVEWWWNKLQDPTTLKYFYETDTPEKYYLTISLKALRHSIKYSKENNEPLDFIDKLLAIFNFKTKIDYYWNWQERFVGNYSVNNYLWWKYEILNWKQYYYLENGQMTSDLNYDNWVLDWTQHFYFDDWSVFASWYFEKWNWNIEYYSPEWNVIWKWEYINNQIYSWLTISPKTVCYWWWWEWNNSYPIFPIVSIHGNYMDWKLNWEYKEYYLCDNKSDWSIISNTCLYNWPLALSGYYENWIAVWEFTRYYDDWNILEKCSYENWIWDCIGYYPDGKVLRDWKRNWKEGNQEFWDWNYYDENWELLEIIEHNNVCPDGTQKYKAY